MRYLLLLSFFLITAPTLANAAVLVEPDSPELRQCVDLCGRMKKNNVDEYEACNIGCVRADKKRKHQNSPTPVLPVRK